MSEFKLGVVESRFADIIWCNEPLHSRELVKLCEQELSWNRSTTYTVLRKLCERGIFKNEGARYRPSYLPARVLCRAERAICRRSL